MIKHPKIESYGTSDIGRVRPNNEDVWAALHEYRFFTIADGMGGHKAGEVAAKEAVNHVCQLLTKNFSINQHILTANQIISHMRLAIIEANHRVFSLSKNNESLSGMGTTLCCLCIYENQAVYAHVGDSRIYHYQNNKITQLTIDHSLVNKLKTKGLMNEEQVMPRSYKNIITKAIGTHPKIEPSIASTNISSNDYFILCTDGLSDFVTNDAMETIVRNAISTKKISESLILEAKKNGSTDNITVLTIKVDDVPEI